MNKTKLGSKTAKGGFTNEKAICRKFNAWEKDREAQEWLKIMGYDIKKVDSVKATKVPTRIKKSDLTKFGVNEEEYEQFVRFKKADAQINSKIGDRNNSIPKYKKCKCPDDCFEVIVVDCDENFDDRSTIYYHCMNCGTDFAVVDFYTMETLYQNI